MLKYSEASSCHPSRLPRTKCWVVCLSCAITPTGFRITTKEIASQKWLIDEDTLADYEENEIAAPIFDWLAKADNGVLFGFYSLTW
jgi:hypothetical protein